jgi:hypothetical protein
MLNVRNSTTKIRATEFPSFLYPSDTNYNPEKPLAGLFHGPLLIRASTMTYIYHRLTDLFIRCTVAFLHRHQVLLTPMKRVTRKHKLKSTKSRLSNPMESHMQQLWSVHRFLTIFVV